MVNKTPKILEILNLLREHYNKSKESNAPYKVKAYENAINNISKYNEPITGIEDTDMLYKQGLFGERIRNRIFEIINAIELEMPIDLGINEEDDEETETETEEEYETETEEETETETEETEDEESETETEETEDEESETETEDEETETEDEDEETETEEDEEDTEAKESRVKAYMEKIKNDNINIEEVEEACNRIRLENKKALLNAIKNLDKIVKNLKEKFF